MLASLVATTTLVATRDGGRTIEVGVAAVAVVLCVAVVVLRRNLLLGLVVAAGFAALVRLIG